MLVLYEYGHFSAVMDVHVCGYGRTPLKVMDVHNANCAEKKLKLIQISFQLLFIEKM